MPRLEARGVSKHYGSRRVLDQIDFSTESGPLIVMMGRSGSGKSTLVRILAGLEKPSSGHVLFDGADVAAMDEDQRDTFRLGKVGIVFQDFRLLPDLTVAENVRLPLELHGRRHPPTDRRKAKERMSARVALLLRQVGMADHAQAFPETLSGGEQQRTAVARALANDPPLVLADEPTANLDDESAQAVMRLLDGSAQAGRIVIVASHDEIAARHAGRHLKIEDGRLMEANPSSPRQATGRT